VGGKEEEMAAGAGVGPAVGGGMDGPMFGLEVWGGMDGSIEGLGEDVVGFEFEGMVGPCCGAALVEGTVLGP
jgi:hypothetical protein